ncbi:MAG: hypothetical protein PUB18_01070 [bacterium]|nr:hypothetical protein [bacterium]
MSSIEKIEFLLKNKIASITDDSDYEKCEVIKGLLSDPNCFFKISFETAIGIMNFLGVEENEILNLYSDLTSPDNYVKSFPKGRILIDSQK